MVIGAVGCGKTTLCQRLHEMEMTYKKTQAMTYFPNAIDTPGEFTQMRSYYHALLVTQSEVEMIAILQSATTNRQIFPPLFTQMFTKPSIGIVTKTDLASTEQILLAENQLKLAGIKQTFHVSSTTGEGLEELLAFLQA